MVNINLVCQSAPKEPLQARVSRGAVATAITACGFVTSDDFIVYVTIDICCNSDYRLRFCNPKGSDGRLKFTNEVATAITACGFVTFIELLTINPKIFRRCNSDYRLRFCNIYELVIYFIDYGCNSDYRLRFCNEVTW